MHVEASNEDNPSIAVAIAQSPQTAMRLLLTNQFWEFGGLLEAVNWWSFLLTAARTVKFKPFQQVGTALKRPQIM